MSAIASPLCRIANYCVAAGSLDAPAYDQEGVARLCESVRRLGFDSMLWSEHEVAGAPANPGSPRDGRGLDVLAQACHQSGLALLVDIAAPTGGNSALQNWYEHVLNRLPDGI